MSAHIDRVRHHRTSPNSTAKEVSSQGGPWATRRDTFARLQRLGLDFHFTRRTGELTTRVVGDTTQIEDFVSDRAPALAQVIGTFAAMVVVLFWLDWRLALITTVAVPPSMYLTITWFVGAIKARSKTHRAETGNLNANHVEKVRALAARPDVDEVMVVISERARDVPETDLMLDADVAERVWSLYLGRPSTSGEHRWRRPLPAPATSGRVRHRFDRRVLFASAATRASTRSGGTRHPTVGSA